MTDTVLIRDIQNCDQQAVTLKGWLIGKRSGGKILFLLVRDGTGVCQCVVEAAQTDIFDQANQAGLESSLIVTGRIRKEARVPDGVEMAVSGLQMIQSAEGYPLARKAHGIDFLMNHRHLGLRLPRQTAILRVRHTLIRAACRFFDDHGFTRIDTPILLSSATEATGTSFPVDYFGERVYLAQTGQFHLESAAMALSKVYRCGPAFRAEKSETRRHLAEFWMIEPEVAFTDLPDLQALAEDLLGTLVETALKENRAELGLLGRNIGALEAIRPPFPRITYSEALDLLHSPGMREQAERRLDEDRTRLRKEISRLDSLDEQRPRLRQGWQQDKLDRQIQDLRESLYDLETDLRRRAKHLEDALKFEWGKDLGGDEEALISQHFDKPVTITEYPRRAKAFYMKISPCNPEVVLNMDVLAPEGYGAIIGGSQREDCLETLAARMMEEGINPEPYEWYLDLRRFGSVPHGGFGLGIERTVAWICGLNHIRETIPFPRWIGHTYP